MAQIQMMEDAAKPYLSNIAVSDVSMRFAKTAGHPTHLKYLPGTDRLAKVRMTEADYEYLLHTLSEARSRASEIATTVRSRVGVDHRLAELGSSAVSQIEALLREIRRVATDDSEASFMADIRTTPASQSGPPAARVENTASSVSPAAQAAKVASEHWFPGFINDLLGAFQSSGRISFETVESLLNERKEAFMQDLETTRKMYREYPHLFKEKT